LREIIALAPQMSSLTQLKMMLGRILLLRGIGCYLIKLLGLLTCK